MKSLSHLFYQRGRTAIHIALSLILLSAPVLAWPTVHPSGTTLYNPEAADDGYTLFAPVGRKDEDSTVFLIDMRGGVVHRWRSPTFALQARLLSNGNLLFVGQSEREGPGRPGVGKYWIGGAAGILQEITWDGKIVFEHEDLKMHHDAIKLPNGHYLYLAWEQVPRALQTRVRGGIKGSEFAGGVMFNDYLVEIDGQGQVVWTWHANEHLNPEVDIIGPFYKREEWCHGNALAVLPDGNIVLTARALDAVMVIERKTGKIIFRWGNTAYIDNASGRTEYRNGPDYMGGPHGADVIPSGLPGAGHILCYDNGLYNFASRAVEIDIKAKKLVWQSSQPGMGRKTFSDIMGNSQRLPNGNTLICDGANGRFFEETAQHGLVWEYQNPYITDPLLQGAVLKIHRYSPNYCSQFKALPPAGGEAILPAASTLSATGADQTAPGSGQNAETGAVGTRPVGTKRATTIAVLFFVLGMVVTLLVTRWQRATNK